MNYSGNEQITSRDGHSQFIRISCRSYLWEHDIKVYK